MLKNKKMKIIISFVFAFSILFISNNVKASTSLSATATNVVVGTSVTVTASVNAGEWTLELTGAGQSKDMPDATSRGNDSKSVSITFTPTKADKYIFYLKGEEYDFYTENGTKVDKNITIVAREKESLPTNPTTNNNSNSNSNNTNTTKPKETTKQPEKSSEAVLSNLGIKPNDFSGFKASKTSYDITVPKDVEKVNVYATAGKK